MSKLTYLQLVNRVLKRITQPELSSGVSTATGQAKIISELINEAQNELWTEASNWHSLLKLRTFSTVTYTADTISFADSDPDTILDSASGFGDLQAGQTIVISGSASNDGVYVIATSATDTLTLQSSDSLTVEAAGENITIYAVSYPVASDWGRTHTLADYTSNRILTEETFRTFVESDPSMDSFNRPYCFSVVENMYHLYYIPNGAYRLIDRYWAIPTALSADSDTSDLPEFCENFIIHWAWMSILQYLNKFDAADRIAMKIYGNPAMKDPGILQKAKLANSKIIDQMFAFGGSQTYGGIEPPKLSSHYGRYW